MKPLPTEALLAFLIVWMIAQIAYIKHATSSFNMDGVEYVKVAVMKYDNNGDELYFPVFRRHSK